MMLGLLAQLTVSGFINGSLLALLAVSFGVILGTTRTFHFAHGIVYTVGAYAAYLFAAQLSLPIGVAVLLAVGVAALLGVGIEIGIYQPLRRLYASPLTVLVASLGTLIAVENIIAILFSTDAKIISGFYTRPFIVGSVAFTSLHLATVIVSWGLFAALMIYLHTTRTGKAMRAVATSPEMAEIVGIDTRRIFIWSFALGSALVAPGAILFTLDKGATPEMGLEAILLGAIAVIVGGIGSIPGAALGGLLIGLMRSLGIWFIPSQWQNTIAFGILIIVILFRPTGLLGTGFRKAEV